MTMKQNEDSFTYLYRCLAESADVSRQDHMNPSELTSKLFEEGGEFASAVLVEIGAIRHKQLDEDYWSEAGDVINTLLGTLVKLNPNMTTNQILQRLAAAVETKTIKYNNICQLTSSTEQK